MRSRTLIRKTSLLRKIDPIARRSSFANKIIYNSRSILRLRRRERRNDLEIMMDRAQLLARPNSDRSPLYDVRNHARAHPVKDERCEVMFRGRLATAHSRTHRRCFKLIWWSQTGSNRRPHACKARALPAELWPRTRRRMLTGWIAETHALDEVVGLGRLELPTSRLSSARSNQLSYKPLTLSLSRIEARCPHPTCARRDRTAQPLARVRPRRKRNEDGEIPPMELNDLAISWPLMFLKDPIDRRSF